MLKAKKRSGRWYSRKRGFASRRLLAQQRDGDFCRVSGLPLFAIVGSHRTYFRACDHLYPERWVRSYYRGADPHILENLITVRPEIHAKKTAAEKYLYAGNWRSFLEIVEPLGYTLEMFQIAAAALNRSVAERSAKKG